MVRDEGLVQSGAEAPLLVAAAPGTADGAVGAADAALYAAKREGRDCSVRSSRVAEPGEALAHPSLRRGAGARERSRSGG
jgi:hypothetical protein